MSRCCSARRPTWCRARPRTRSPTGCAHDCRTSTAYGLTRWKNVLLQMYFYNLRAQEAGRRQEAPDRDGEGRTRRRHRHGEAFHPRYNPWDQRLCLLPDGDMWQTCLLVQFVLLWITLGLWTVASVQNLSWLLGCATRLWEVALSSGNRRLLGYDLLAQRDSVVLRWKLSGASSRSRTHGVRMERGVDWWNVMC